MRFRVLACLAALACLVLVLAGAAVLRGAGPRTVRGVTASADSFVLFVHVPDFQIPVPSNWTTMKDANVSGHVYELVATGPTFGNTRTNVVVDGLADPAAGENPFYLSGLVNETMMGVQQSHPDANLSGAPELLTVSNHSAVAFTILYPSLSVDQRAVIVVDAPLRKDWLLLLTTADSAFALNNGTFAQMVPGFLITQSPPAPPSSPPAALFDAAQVLGAVLFVVAIVVLLAVLVRRRRPSAPTLASLRCATCFSPLEPGARFCGTCGQPVLTGPPPPVLPPPGAPPPTSPPPGAGPPSGPPPGP